MSDEAVCIETPSRFGRFIIAAGAVLPFGTVVKLSADNTVIASDSADDPIEGIVWERASTATSTHTEITVALDGVWDMKDSGAGVTRGIAVAIGGANLIITADSADFVSGSFIGYPEETVGASGTVRVRWTKFGSSGKL